MPNKTFTVFAFFLLWLSATAQSTVVKNDSLLTKTVPPETALSTRPSIDPLVPARAAFYSAVLPGLGQAYNKRYWKIPIIYAALGVGISIYKFNDKEYKKYRDAYKSRLAGFKNDIFYLDVDGNQLAVPRFTMDRLERAQILYKKNRELTLFAIIGIYILNVVDANVNAHLLSFNIDRKVSLVPHVDTDAVDAKSHFGLALRIQF